MIKVTADARTKVSQLMEEEGFNPDLDYIRVGVKVVDVLAFHMILHLIIYNLMKTACLKTIKFGY